MISSYSSVAVNGLACSQNMKLPSRDPHYQLEAISCIFISKISGRNFTLKIPVFLHVICKLERADLNTPS